MFGRINNLLYAKRRAGNDVIDLGRHLVLPLLTMTLHQFAFVAVLTIPLLIGARSSPGGRR